MTSLIIFDLDGTLIDSRADLATGVNLALKQYQLPPLSIDTITGYIGNGARKLMERVLKGSDVDVDEAVLLLKRFYGENLLNHTTLYPGVEEGLKTLSALGIPLAVITNKPGPLATKILQGLGVAPLFTHILGGDVDLPLKPDPATLLKVMSDNEATPENTWMMGDNYTDMESGRRAGVKRCLAAYGFGNPRNELHDLKVDAFSEFVDAIR